MRIAAKAENKGKQMKLKIVTVQVVLLLSISTAALAQNSNPQLPRGAQVDPLMHQGQHGPGAGGETID
jgi:hypothetical protein